MAAQELLTSLSNVPSAAIVFFFVLGAVLVAELWYLRPKRKLPPIPSLEERPAPPSLGQPAAPLTPLSPTSPVVEPAGFKPLSQKQIYMVGFLIFLLVIIPLAVFLFKRTEETKKAVTLLPTPTAALREFAPPTEKPLSTPTFIPLPEKATPSATPRRMAGGTLTTPTATPTATPEWRSKGGELSSTSSATPLPKAKKPEELPDASFPEQAVFLALVGLPALVIGAKGVRKRLRE